uniref:NADH-ubiquinone oxidoreductase chain 6 n=1 Tax=Angaria neglecta TaxID=1740283 RepID=A0A0S1F5K6_9VEST|nr:NADH dehydrogenase subunit 6 [Angaria neglecta]ALK03358.1 NADH dehydrogenase subunit 6 [Angaria neglecta]
MAIMTLSSLSLSLLLLMFIMLQPLSLGLCIMALSTSLCILIGLISSSWYGYILFLIYIGGLLVMFAYVSALAPNNFFSSIKAISLFLTTILVFLMLTSTLYTMDLKFMEYCGSLYSSKTMHSSGRMLISPSNMSLMIILGVILLINLLAVVKICYYQQGPLRSHMDLK